MTYAHLMRAQLHNLATNMHVFVWPAFPCLGRARRGLGLSTAINCCASGVLVLRLSAFLQYLLANESKAAMTYVSSG